MSATRNADSITSAQGEVHSRIPRTAPSTTKGHAPGVKVGNDAAPEFSAQTLPAGTAPSDRTFQPNPTSEIPGQSPDNEPDAEGTTSASDTINGATSADVHTGYGHPGSGQTSNELRGVRKKEKNGLAGVGADPSDSFRERGLDIEHPKGTKGKNGENREDILGAEERLPESAESVAAERP